MTTSASAPEAHYALQDDALILDGQRYARAQITQVIFHPHARVVEQKMGGWLPGIVAFMAISIAFGTSVGFLLSNIGPMVYATIFIVAAVVGLYVGIAGLPNRTKQYTGYGVALQLQDGSRHDTDAVLSPDNAALLRDQLARSWSLHAQWRSLSSYQA